MNTTKNPIGQLTFDEAACWEMYEKGLITFDEADHMVDGVTLAEARKIIASYNLK